MNNVIVIGGGASGMLAAFFAANEGSNVTLIEKNEKLGKKIYITGKGRCNITNACDWDTFFENVVTGGKFLFSSYSAFDNFSLMDLFESAGLSMKTERGNRVFPVSDHASDVTKALKVLLDRVGVNVKLNNEVNEILYENTDVMDMQQPESNNGFIESKQISNDTHDKYKNKSKCKNKNIKKVTGVALKNGTVINCYKVIVCTGGLSYPSTGSTGFGIEKAKELGLKIADTSPSLVPINTKESYVTDMQGLALKNVRVTVTNKKNKTLYSGFGEMLFTHFGVSGPLILSASAYITKAIKEEPLDLRIDLKPALDEATLDKRLLKMFDENKNKALKNALVGLLPNTMVPVLIKVSNLSPDKKVNEVSKEERDAIIKNLKAFPLTLVSLRGYNEAIITKGGISTKEINPKTMECKTVQGLYFAGEVLDVDALTGGFNLQVAWTTGAAAGKAAGMACYV